MAEIPNIQPCDKGPKSLEIINQVIDKVNNLPVPLTCEELENCQTIQDIEQNIVNLQNQINTLTEPLIDVVVTENIIAFECVNSDGSKADSSLILKRNKLAGIAIAPINNGFSGKVKQIGTITNPVWNFIKGDIIFLNGTILSASPPSTGFSQMIGKAVNNNTIEILINQAIRL